MKKLLLLLASITIVGLSVQAGDWRTEPDLGRAEELAREYFWKSVRLVTHDDIRTALKKFPQFLEWEDTFDDSHSDATITHFVAAMHESSDVFGFLLGFTPNLEKKSKGGFTVLEVCNQTNKDVLSTYLKCPWVYEEVDSADDLGEDVDGSVEKASFLSALLSKRVLASAGVLILLSLLYRYKTANDKRQSGLV